MEIKFLLPDGTLVSNPYDIPTELTQDQLNFYVNLKSLEYRENVVDSISDTKKNHLIPESGYDTKFLLEFYNLKQDKRNYKKMLVDQDKTVDYEYFIKKSQEWFKLLGISNSFESKVTHDHALADIILFNTVLVSKGFPKIYVDRVKDSLFGDQIHIILNSQTSKEELLNYIKKNYEKEIKPSIKTLSRTDPVLLRKTDIDILDMKDKKGLTFPKIADALGKDFSEPKVRRAYHWSKEEIAKQSYLATDDDHLTEREKNILRYFYIDRIPFKEIASKLGPANREKVSEKTIEEEFIHSRNKIMLKAIQNTSEKDILNPTVIRHLVNKALSELM